MNNSQPDPCVTTIGTAGGTGGIRSGIGVEVSAGSTSSVGGAGGTPGPIGVGGAGGAAVPVVPLGGIPSSS